MARLRAAYVEYRRCQGCGKDYVGTRCYHCGKPQELSDERLPKELLIIDGDDPPHYQRQERWRCRHCKRLYLPPSGQEIVAALEQDGNIPLTPEQIETELQGIQSMLQGVRRLHAALKKQGCRPHYQQSLTLRCWCPFCKADPPHGDYLPNKPTWVYVACRAQRIPLDTLAVQVEFDDDGNIQPTFECPDISVDHADPDEEE